MEGTAENNQVNQDSIFQVPLNLAETNENITLSINTSSKYSKKQIINQAYKFHSQGNILESIKYYQYFIDQGFSDPQVFSNYGAILKNLGKLQEAKKITHKAIEINPNLAEAHSNLGNILIALGKLQEAEISYQKAIKIKPDFADAYLNLGAVKNRLGELSDAADFYKKAISLKADWAEAHRDLGNVLRELGQIKEAESFYEKAINLKADFIGAAWNLYCLANSIEDAEKRIKQCLRIDENYLDAKLTICALKLHQGDCSFLNEAIKSVNKNHPFIRTFKWVSTLPEIPKLFFHRWAFFDAMINESKRERPFYEFGVWRGTSFKYLIKAFKKGFGFDTFTGLPEKWHKEFEGTYSSMGIIPKIKGGTFIKGKFNDTLPIFFSKARPLASIINFDSDLYSSTLCALTYSKPIMDKHTILIFDEFIINKNWEEDEYKALNKFCLINNLSYEVIAVSYVTKQVAVKLRNL